MYVAEPDGKAQSRAVVTPHTTDAVCATGTTKAGNTPHAERTRRTCDAADNPE